MQTTLDPELELRLIDKHDGWSTIYQHICTEAQQRFELSFSDSRRTEFRMRNRYKDISPYDHSRIKLKRNNIDYINASHVEVPLVKRVYILTQGPLPQTVSHFWVMVWERNCPAILMLNRFIEKDQPKCHQYFPFPGDNHLLLEDVGLKISFMEGREDASQHFVTRFLRIEDVKSKEKRDILHFHYLLWPDFGVPPSPDSFLDYLFSVRASGVLDNPEHPVVVHCSAGVGRSGVFCIVDACIKMAETKNNGIGEINLRRTLIEMRRFRMGLIQTPQQLRFAYVALVEALKKLNLAKNSTSFIPPDVEDKFLVDNFSVTPTLDLVDEDDEDEEEMEKSQKAGNASSNSFGEQVGISLRTRRGSDKKTRKRCSLGRFMPHPGSVEDPESVWLLNNSTISGEPLIKPGPSETFLETFQLSHSSVRRPPFSSVDGFLGLENGDEGDDDKEEEGSGVDEGDDDKEEEGSGVDEDFVGEDDDDEECSDGHGCSSLPERRPLSEREMKSWEEIKIMMKKQECCEELTKRRRKRMKIKVIGWSVIVAIVGVIFYWTI